MTYAARITLKSIPATGKRRFVRTYVVAKQPWPEIGTQVIIPDSPLAWEITKLQPLDRVFSIRFPKRKTSVKK